MRSLPFTLLLSALLVVPLVGAQSAVDPTRGEDATPAEGVPDVDTPDGEVAEGSGAPTEEGSVEGGPGVAYGIAVLVGTLAFAGALGYASWRYAKRKP